jgi:hypothetical protein
VTCAPAAKLCTAGYPHLSPGIRQPTAASGQSRARDIDFRFTLDSGSYSASQVAIETGDKRTHSPAARHLSSAASWCESPGWAAPVIHPSGHPATAKCGTGQGQNVLWCRTGSRLALLNDERRNEFQWGGAVVEADVNLASINIERLSCFISGHWATFVFKGQRSFQDVT